MLSLRMLTAELRLRGHRRYARVSHGAARPVERQRLGASLLPTTLALAGVVALAVGIPTYSLLHWLAVGSSTEFPLGDLLAAAGTSLGLGAAAAAVTVLLALPVAWLAVRYRTAASTAVERSTPILVPAFAGARSLDLGFSFTLIVGADGVASAVGENTFGRLGDGTAVDRLQPVKVVNLSGS